MLVFIIFIFVSWHRTILISRPAFRVGCIYGLGGAYRHGTAASYTLWLIAEMWK